MKKSIFLLLILLCSSAHAKVFLQIESTFCKEIMSDDNIIIHKLFCQNTDSFSLRDVCIQLDCLLTKHITHCRRSLETISHAEGMTFSQGSLEARATESALSSYCID